MLLLLIQPQARLDVPDTAKEKKKKKGEKKKKSEVLLFYKSKQYKKMTSPS